MSKELKLQQYFNFTPNDLQANRQGRVTENQQMHIKGKVQRFNSRILIFIAVVLMISMGAFFAVRMVAASSNSDSELSTSFLLGPAITLIVLTVFMASRTNKKNDYSLKQVEGTVNFVWVERRVANQDNTGYKTEKSLQMRVDGVSFNVSQNLMDIIDQSDNVRFYYTVGGDIVSAEFVER